VVGGSQYKGVHMPEFIAAIIVIVALQTYLSGRQQAMLGLILPILNILYAIFMVVRLGTDDRMEMFSTFVLFNVSTVMLMVVYITVKKTKYDKDKPA